MGATGRFRELTCIFRDCALEAPATPPTPWRDILRTRSVGLILAMFVAASGAFGTSQITPDVRYPIIAALALLVMVIDFAITTVFERLVRFKLPPLRVVVRVLMIVACTTLACWGTARLFEGASGTPPLLRFIVPVLVFAAAAAALGRISMVLRTPTSVPNRVHPAFVDRLPHPLRSAEIVAVEGEDHYVHVHTSLGRHLLLMRFGDALSELKMLDGLQTHRSWWVARSAVMAVKRGNGRATLTLANGLKAPVSRRFAQSLRELGWY